MPEDITLWNNQPICLGTWSAPILLFILYLSMSSVLLYDDSLFLDVFYHLESINLICWFEFFLHKWFVAGGCGLFMEAAFHVLLYLEMRISRMSWS